MGIFNQIRLIETIEYAFTVLSPNRYCEFLRFYDLFIQSSSTLDASSTGCCVESVSGGEYALGNPNHIPGNSVDIWKSKSTSQGRRIHSLSGRLSKWFSLLNPSRVDKFNDDEMIVEEPNESTGNKIDTRHAYLRFIDFVERLDEFQNVQKMSLDIVFVKFGVLAVDINYV
jgi:hypothetical protein